jgi:malonyl-CoA/methylmalonyl-CoA synthetase
VLGVPHEELGQVVTALIYANKQQQQQQEAGLDATAAKQQLVTQLRELCGRELPAYSVPREWVLLDEPLPRNAMGKVNKKELLKSFA